MLQRDEFSHRRRFGDIKTDAGLAITKAGASNVYHLVSPADENATPANARNATGKAAA
jgi:hypothetical protein